MTLVNKILILGAGQSAVHAASEIRKHDTDSIIKIFNQEDYLPYERPPLSKEFLMNEKKEDEFLFFSKNFFEEQRIELINNAKGFEDDFATFTSKILEIIFLIH